LVLPGPSLFPRFGEGPDTGLGTTRSFSLAQIVRIYFSSRMFLKQRPFTYNFQGTAMFFETESRIEMTPEILLKQS
jgi:hypothetical protein